VGALLRTPTLELEKEIPMETLPNIIVRSILKKVAKIINHHVTYLLHRNASFLKEMQAPSSAPTETRADPERSVGVKRSRSHPMVQKKKIRQGRRTKKISLYS
jgi:hypothetical protein